MTSHDVVALTRRKIGTKKICHCGTLDPIATGLLLLTVGRGTKVQDLLMSEDKEYAGTFVLGVTTDTQDREGKVIQERPVPALDQNQIRAAFEKFRGDFYQLPPMVSAKKHAGVPLYKLARQGKVVEREPRLVHVYRYTIDRIALPEIDFSVMCSKGFYVRTYVHDIGEALGCGAHLKSLRRTKSGRFGSKRDHGRSNQKCNARRNSQPDAEPAGSFQDARSVRNGDAPIHLRIIAVAWPALSRHRRFRRCAPRSSGGHLDLRRTRQGGKWNTCRSDIRPASGKNIATASGATFTHRHSAQDRVDSRAWRGPSSDHYV